MQKIIGVLMINEKRIQYLLSVAQEQNITTAAKKLYISQPALSRMILDLEQELGTPLFIRERNALRLTQAGAVYLRGCRQILAIDRSVKREISDLLSSRRGKITLAVTALTGEFLLPRILNAFEMTLIGRTVRTEFSLLPVLPVQDPKDTHPGFTAIPETPG